jgi:hypothetical protein
LRKTIEKDEDGKVKEKNDGEGEDGGRNLNNPTAVIELPRDPEFFLCSPADVGLSPV